MFPPLATSGSLVVSWLAQRHSPYCRLKILCSGEVKVICSGLDETAFQSKLVLWLLILTVEVLRSYSWILDFCDPLLIGRVGSKTVLHPDWPNEWCPIKNCATCPFRSVSRQYLRRRVIWVRLLTSRHHNDLRSRPQSTNMDNIAFQLPQKALAHQKNGRDPTSNFLSMSLQKLRSFLFVMLIWLNAPLARQMGNVSGTPMWNI